MPLEIVSQGVIYRNPYPGYRAVTAVMGQILPLTSSHWLCAFRQGSAFFSDDGMIHIARSRDMGASWEHEGPVHRLGSHEKGYNYTSPELSIRADGAILLAAFRVDQSDPQKLFVNAETGGLLPIENIFFVSMDEGCTWSRPQPITLPAEWPTPVVGAPNGPIIELDDGRWFFGLETWKAYDDTGPPDFRSLGLFSDDGGDTWGALTTIADGRGRNRAYSHGRFTKRLDGRLFAMLWTGTADMSASFELHAVVSDVTGRQWSGPRPTGLPGQTNWAVDLGDGRMAAIYTRRDSEQPGLVAVISEDDGMTWNTEEQVMVWDAYGKEALGVPRTDRYPSSHDAIAYGKPHAARLSCDEFVTTFWCTQGADTHVRYCQLKVV